MQICHGNQLTLLSISSKRGKEYMQLSAVRITFIVCAKHFLEQRREQRPGGSHAGVEGALGHAHLGSKLRPQSPPNLVLAEPARLKHQHLPTPESVMMDTSKIAV